MQGLTDLVDKYFSLPVIKEVLPYLLKGALFTILFSAASEIIGIIIGLLTSIVRVTRIKVLNHLAIVYLSLIHI